jgi:NMD protein affecting ribosome stability and mRNA decay
MNNLSCPYCASTRLRLLEALFTIRFVARPVGEPAGHQKCHMYRCCVCGREFDEVEAEECPVLEEDVDNDIKKMDLIRRQVHLNH